METILETTAQHEYLSREAAYRVACNMEDESMALKDFAQVIIDLASSDNMEDNLARGIYRVGLSIAKHQEKLEALRCQLFHGLHPNTQPTL